MALPPPEPRGRVGLPALAGWTVGVTADRRAEEQAELLGRRGAKVVHGSCIRTLPLELDDSLRRATEALIADPPDVVVLTTGVGTRAWLAAAESLGRDSALLPVLGRATVLTRGPKAAGAAVTAGLEVAWRAESERSAAIIDHLVAGGRLRGCRVAVQRDGAPVAFLADALAAHGADVVDVVVYRWVPPVDPEPARRLIDGVVDGRLDAVTFTSTPAVDGFLALAEEAGGRDDVVAALNGPVRPVCVGPVCAENAERAGILGPVQPNRARLGAMVQALAADAGAARVERRVGAVDVVLQGSILAVGHARIELPGRERAMLGALADRPGVVVSKGELARRVWNRPDLDPHAVEVAAARLRTRLREVGLAVESVARRGYRLVPAVT